MKTCQDCKHFKLPVEHEGVKFGHCFRYPPELLDEGKSQAIPVRAELLACGEFKRKWFGHAR